MVNRFRLIGFSLEALGVVLVIENDEGECLMVMKIIHQSQNSTVAVRLPARGGIDTANWHKLDPKPARMHAEPAFKYLPDGKFFGRSFDDQAYLGLGVNAVTICNKLQVTPRILADLQFWHMGDDCPGDFVGVRKVNTV